MECGSLLSTDGGPFVCCEVCRALYYVDIVANYENKPVIIIQPTHLEPDQEFDIIRSAYARTPLKEYLPNEADAPGTDWGNYLPKPNAENINPHFDKDLKSIIDKAVTPSDIIRGLEDGK